MLETTICNSLQNKENQVVVDNILTIIGFCRHRDELGDKLYEYDRMHNFSMESNWECYKNEYKVQAEGLEWVWNYGYFYLYEVINFEYIPILKVCEQLGLLVFHGNSEPDKNYAPDGQECRKEGYRKRNCGSYMDCCMGGPNTF